MNISAISLLYFSSGVLLIGMLSLIKRKDNSGLNFFFFSIAVSGWSFFAAMSWSVTLFPFEVMLLLKRVSFIFGSFIPVTWTHFVFNFIQKKEPWPSFYRLNYLFGAIFSICSTTPYFVSSIVPLEGHYSPVPGPLFYAFTAQFFVLIPYAFWHLLQAYLHAQGQIREQLKYLVIGTAIGFAAGSGMFPICYKILIPAYLLIFMPLYPLFTGIALMRYGLFDTRELADAFQREKLTALGMIAASLNHELRNPLYVAKGRMESYIDAAERNYFAVAKDKNEKADEVIALSLQQLNRAMDIMQRFSDFAKPHSTSLREKEIVEVSDTIEDVLKLVSKEFEMKKIRISEKPEEEIAVKANRRQLEEIFFNLVINACHAMGEKGGELSIKAHQPKGKVVVEVSDTGAGIAKENQRRIFEPFFTTKSGKGTGLGLYITKQLVERNGGKISVASKPGFGTKFTLEFQGV